MKDSGRATLTAKSTRCSLSPSCLREATSPTCPITLSLLSPLVGGAIIRRNPWIPRPSHPTSCRARTSPFTILVAPGIIHPGAISRPSPIRDALRVHACCSQNGCETLDAFAAASTSPRPVSNRCPYRGRRGDLLGEGQVQAEAQQNGALPDPFLPESSQMRRPNSYRSGISSPRGQEETDPHGHVAAGGLFFGDIAPALPILCYTIDIATNPTRTETTP